MAIIGPPLLALAGGAFGGQIGMAAGWLIGAWLFAPKQQAQNQIFDPGAQELPPINQALRGSTLPVLFGTNRVPANIIWTHDFETIRTESSQSASSGKPGGSGGKGATGVSTSVSYRYKIDVLYHLGMVPEQYGLFGGWLGPERLNSSTVVALQSNTNLDFAVFFGLPNPDQTAQSAGLAFQEGFYYNGYGPALGDAESPGWEEITSDMGVAVRWPHTVWIGIKQLDMGDTPHLPQLTFEVGPGSAVFEFNSAYIDQVASTSTGNLKAPNISQFIIGDDGHFYTVGVETSNTAHIDRFDVGLGTYTETDTLTRTDHTAAMKANGAPDVGYDYGNSAAWTASMLQNSSKYFVVWGWGEHPVSLRASIGFGLYKINASGEAEMAGFYMTRTDQVLGALRPGTIEAIAISNEGTDDDPIISFIIDQVAGTITPRVLLFPSINSLLGFLIADTEDGATQYSNNSRSFNATTVDGVAIGLGFGNHSSYRTGANANFGWFMPKATIGLLGIEWGSTLNFYIDKAALEWHLDNPGSGNDYIEDTAGTYPNGHAFKLDYNQIVFGTTPDSPTTSIINDKFVDRETFEVVMPFNDEGKDVAGGAETISGYTPRPTIQKITSGEATGGYACLWGKMYQPSLANSPTGEYITIRGFIYNPLDEEYLYFGDGAGTTLDTVDDLGQSEGNRYNGSYYHVYPVWDQATNSVYKVGLFHGGISFPPGDVHLANAGDLNIGGGGDVLPPYIIHQILTSDVFGIGIDPADIDQSSYESALLYCDANNFRVSTQIRRERQVLDIINSILSTYGGMLIVSDKIKFLTMEFNNGAAGTVRTLDNDHFIRKSGGAPVRVTDGARQDTFNKVKVNYLDRSIAYHQNQVEIGDEVDQDTNGIRPREFPAEFVMGEQMASTIAARALWSNLYSKDTYDFQLGWKDADLEPGDVVTVVDSFHNRLRNGVTARIVQWKETERGIFDVIAKQEHAYISATSGDFFNISSASNNPLIGPIPNPLYFRAYELPCEFTSEGNPGIYTGWVSDEFAAGGALYVSADGASYSEVAQAEPYPLAGRIISGLPLQAPGTFNEGVELLLAPTSDWVETTSYYYSATLPEVSQAGRANGTGLLYVGSEMMAYENVTLLGQNHYRLGKVYRGYGETPIHSHSSGDFWWKHGGGVFFSAINEQKIGTTISYKVQPYNIARQAVSIDSIDAQTYSILGTYFKPQNPPTPRLVVDSVDYRGQTTLFANSEIDIPIEWRDSSRLSGYGYRGYGVGEYGRFSADPRSHDWRVEIIGSGDIVVRSTVSNAPSYIYTSSMNFEDNGAWRGNVAAKVTAFNEIGDSQRTEVLSLEIW